MKPAPVTARVVRAFRVLTLALTAVRIALLPLCLHLITLQLVAPVDDHFFPVIARRPEWLGAAWLVPIFTNVVAMSAPTAAAMRLASVLEVVASALLLTHQASYYWATWVVFFWAGALLVWLAWSAASHPKRATELGPFLAQVVVAFIFLGGAVGKWTGGYWSGELFDRMYFAGNARSALSLLGTVLTGENRRLAAMWFSRAVVIAETSMVLLPFLPARTASVVSIVMACGLWATATDLYQVCVPLIGIALVGRILSSVDGPETPANAGMPKQVS